MDGKQRPGMLEIAGDPHVRDRDETSAANARVLDLVARQHLTKDGADFPGHPFHPLRQSTPPSA